jgi:hypothetical protein
MKVATSPKLTNRLVQYGALSLAFIQLENIEGQIIYKDIQDSGGQYAVFVLDMDGDAQGDFNIRHNSSTFSFPAYGIYPFDYLAIWPAMSNAVLGKDQNGFQYPFAMNESAIISAGNPNWRSNFNYQYLNSFSCAFLGSEWCDVTDKYLGLRFKIGGDTHYGWARLDVGIAPDDWVIKDAAYNSVAGASIMAGQGIPLGIDEDGLSDTRIVSLNKSLAFYNLPGQVNYKIYNMTGQSVMEGSLNKELDVIEAHGLSNGVYIVELNDNASTHRLRKKVVL